VPIIRDTVALGAAKCDVSRQIGGSSATSGARVREISSTSFKAITPAFGLVGVVETGIDHAARDWRPFLGCA